MSNVLELPESRMRSWRAQERELRAAMLQLPDLTRQDIDYVCQQLQPLYLEWTAVPPFEGSTAEEALQSLNSWMCQCTQAYFLALAQAYIELAQLRGVPIKPEPPKDGVVRPFQGPRG